MAGTPTRPEPGHRSSADHAPERCRILVAEDEYIVAFDLCAELVSLGIEVVGPAASVDQALDLATTTIPLHGAVLDVNVGGRNVFPVADALARRSIPFIFATGYDRSVLPPKYQAIPQVDKPMDADQLEDAIRQMCPSWRIARTVSRT